MGKISAQMKFIPEDSNLIVLTFWVDCYHISSAMKWIFYLQKQSKKIQIRLIRLIYVFGIMIGRESPILYHNFLRLILIFEVILERKNPIFITQ